MLGFLGVNGAGKSTTINMLSTLIRSDNGTTHYMEEAAQAGRIIIISKGNIIAEGTPNELKTRYAADSLRIYCNSQKIPILKSRFSTAKETDNGINLIISTTMEALPILDEIKDIINGFEVIQGTMDDVYQNLLNISVLSQQRQKINKNIGKVTFYFTDVLLYCLEISYSYNVNLGMGSIL